MKLNTAHKESGMPKIIKDETENIIRSEIAKSGSTAIQICKKSGMNVSTLNHHIRNPEMLRLSEIRTLIRYGIFSEDDKRYLLEWRKELYEKA